MGMLDGYNLIGYWCHGSFHLHVRMEWFRIMRDTIGEGFAALILSCQASMKIRPSVVSLLEPL